MTTTLAGLTDLMLGRLAGTLTDQTHVLVGLAQDGHQFAISLHIACMLDICTHHLVAPVLTTSVRHVSVRDFIMSRLRDSCC